MISLTPLINSSLLRLTLGSFNAFFLMIGFAFGYIQSNVVTLILMLKGKESEHIFK
jgi:hypothetical protein